MTSTAARSYMYVYNFSYFSEIERMAESSNEVRMYFG